MYYILYFIVGLFFGSFYYVVGDRGPKNENYINSRSRCDYCLHELKWYELIPLFSYIFQRGKCNYCHKNININHFLIELSTGILFCLGYYLYGNSIQNILYLIIISLLLLIYVSDFKYMVILDSYLYVANILYIIFLFIESGLNTTLIQIAAGILLFFTFYLIKIIFDYIYKRESLGGGDIKLAFFMGLVLGYPLGLTSFALSCFLALPYAFTIMHLNKKNELPFGPFLISACLIVFLFIDKFKLVLDFLFNL